jgi:hypothetical protein
MSRRDITGSITGAFITAPATGVKAERDLDFELSWLEIHASSIFLPATRRTARRGSVRVA